MLSNAHFLAKFRFDTAENKPAKKLQKFCKILQILQNRSVDRAVFGWSVLELRPGGGALAPGLWTPRAPAAAVRLALAAASTGSLPEDGFSQRETHLRSANCIFEANRLRSVSSPERRHCSLSALGRPLAIQIQIQFDDFAKVDKR